MFDVGWSEMLVIACVAVLVVGPRDLPKLLRTVGKTVTTMRRMAGDFQRQFDQAIREAELDEVRKEVKKPFQPLEDARKSAAEFQKQVGASMAELEKDAARPAPAPRAANGDAAPAADPAVAPAADAQPAGPVAAASPADAGIRA